MALLVQQGRTVVDDPADLPMVEIIVSNSFIRKHAFCQVRLVVLGILMYLYISHGVLLDTVPNTLSSIHRLRPYLV